MKRTKMQKGITLVALIITIVVLMILAGVAISSINDNGILSYAQNSADAWNRAQENEATQIQNYLEYLNEFGNGVKPIPNTVWAQRGLTVQPVESDLTYSCEEGTKFGTLTNNSEIVVNLYTNGTYNIQLMGETLTKENSDVEVRNSNTIIILRSGVEYAKIIISSNPNTAKIYIDGSPIGFTGPMWIEGDKTLTLS